MFKYKVHNIPEGIKISKLVIKEIFLLTEFNVKITQKWVINIIFEDDYKIKKLNNEYRWIDSSTDVLSFHYYEDFSKIKSSIVAWEIVLSFNKMKKQSIEYNNTLEEEFYKLLIHSILHIIWYNHEKEKDYKRMNIEEEKIINEINVKFNLSVK